MKRRSPDLFITFDVLHLQTYAWVKEALSDAINLQPPPQQKKLFVKRTSSGGRIDLELV